MTSEKKLITGNIVPTISYFREDGTVQEGACRLQALHALHHGADAIFALGSTGEGVHLKNLNNGNLAERTKLLLVSADAVLEYDDKNNKDVSLMVGVYGETAEEVLEDMKSLQASINSMYNAIGNEYSCLSKIKRFLVDNNAYLHILDAYVIPPPSDGKKTDEQLIEFYEHILKESDLPVYMYNNPKFGGNMINNGVISQLRKYNSLKGIKDSSGTLEKKLEYIEMLDEDFSVSCGKEGMIGTFLKNIAPEKRRLAGIVPSLGNLTANPSRILAYGLKELDEEMIEEQQYMNSFRNILYDASQSKGKSQRGVKRCMKYIYDDHFGNISLFVNPIYKRDIEAETIEKMHEMADRCIKKGDIRPIY